VGAAQWQRVKDLFTSALERAAGEREAFLEERAPAIRSLQGEVEALLWSGISFCKGHGDRCHR
jgi:hypothetical protein